MWGLRGQALFHAQPPALDASSRGPPPAGCGCVGWGPGDPSPTRQSALLRTGFARCGGGTRAPGRGISCLCVGSPGSGALQCPTARPGGVRPGPVTHWLWVRAVWAWGPVTNPEARTLASWLCALWGRHEDARGGGGASCLGLGGPELCALPRRTTRPWGVRPWPATHWLWVRGSWAWGPVTYPTARGLASWLCASQGRNQEASGGGASCLGVGRPGVGALQRPTARPWGVRLGPVIRLLWARGVWAWGPVTNPTACALASRLCALWGGTIAPPGGRLLPARGASEVGRSPMPDRPTLGRAAGAHYPLAVGAGSVGVRTRHQPHSGRSWELGLRAVAAARGRTGRGRLLPG